jgi:hypothetical protein
MIIQIIMAGLMLSVPPSFKCPGIDDSDKRGFRDSDLDPIVRDIDDDGKPDMITPRLVGLLSGRLGFRPVFDNQSEE